MMPPSADRPPSANRPAFDRTGGHPSQDHLAAFSSGRLEEERTAEIETHLEHCASCCSVLASLSRQPDRFVSALIQAAGSGAHPTLETDGHSPQADDTFAIAETAVACAPRKIGRFEVLEQIGHGGFGIVLLADDPQLRRQVAVKIPRPGALLTLELRERFVREAQAAASLDHPHIVPIHEAGEADGVFYIASAYCRGPNLSGWLSQRTEPVPFPVAAQLVRELSTAVQHAHSRGVLHRDLKPSNVLLDGVAAHVPQAHGGDHERPAVGARLPFTSKITDFGLAKVAGDTAEVTRSNIVMGTASYMSPEQAKGDVKQVGEGADIYGLGAILYELLAGRPPFVGESDLDTLQQVQANEPIAPARLRPRVPTDLETICLKCLAKDPRERYASAEDLAMDLRRFLDGNSIHARRISSRTKLWRWCGRHRAVATLTGCLTAAVLLIAVGATVLSVRLAREVRHREDAQQATQGSLFQAHLALARAARMSQSSGRRFDALDAIRKATAIADQLQLDDQAVQQMRAEAVSAMMLRDLQVESTWATARGQHARRRVAFDSALALAALIDDKGRVVVQRCDDLQSQRRLDLPRGSANRIALSDDGRHLAACGSGASTRIFFRNLAAEPDHEGEVRDAGWTAIEFGHAVACFRFLPGTPQLAVVSQNGQALLLDVESGESTKSGNLGFTPRGCAPSPDGSSLAVWGGTLLKVLSLQTDAVIREAPSGDPDILDVAWSPDGRLLAVGNSYHQVEIVTSKWPPMKLAAHDGPVTSVAFGPAGNVLVSASVDGTSRMWDLATGRQVVTCRGRAIRFSADGRQMLGLLDGSIARFRVALGDERQRLADTTIWNVEFNSEETLLAARTPEAVELWDLATRRRVGAIDRGQVMWILFWESPWGTRLVLGAQRRVQIFPLTAGDASESGVGGDWVIGEPVSIPLPETPADTWPSLSRTGKLAIPTYSHRSFIVDLARSGAEVTMLPRGTSRVSLSPDGQWLAAYGDQVSGILVLDEKGQTIRELASGDLITFAGFSPDGRWLAADRGKDVLFYEAATWRLSHRTSRREAEVRNREQWFSFGANGMMLMAGSATSDAHTLIRTSDGATIAIFEGYSGHARLSPSGESVACITHNSIVEFLDLNRFRRQLIEEKLSSLLWR